MVRAASGESAAVSAALSGAAWPWLPVVPPLVGGQLPVLAGAGAGGARRGRGGQWVAGEGDPGERAAAREQGSQGNPYRPVKSLAPVCGQMCLQPRLLLPGVSVAGSGTLLSRGAVLARPELLRGLVILRAAAGGR